MKNFLKIFIFSFSVFALCLSPFSTPAKAVPIGPDKYFFDLKENEVKEEILYIYGRENLANVQRVFLYTVGMRKTGEENARSFFKVDPYDESEVANWIQLEKSEVFLKQGDVLKINWTIKRSDKATCGTNLAAIVAATAPLDNIVDGNQVNFKNEVVSQVHVNINRVNGNDCDKNINSGRLIEFKVNKFWNIFDHQDVPFITRIENDGNYILRQPKGYIEIFQYNKKLDTLDFNENGLDIYPKTIRRFDNNWTDPNFPKNGNFFEQLGYEITHFKLGKFEARLGVTKNISPQIVATTDFWIFPWRTLLMILIIITVFILYRYIRKRLQKEKSNEDRKLR